MTLNLDVSPELAEYSETLKEWGREAVRPYARLADDTHALPELTSEILDTAPVPLDRPDRLDDQLPDFPDGPGVRATVWYESIAYCDIWLSEALGRGVGHHVVDAIGTPEQKERWVRPILLDGSKKTALGLSESGAGSDTSRIATTAVRDGANWILNGSKMYCSSAAIAEYTVVFATTDKEAGRSAIMPFVVEMGTPGLAILKANEDKLGLRCWVTSQIAFDNMVIPAENQVGWTGDPATSLMSNGMNAALTSLNYSRPNVSQISVGLAQAALDVTKDLLRKDQPSFASRRWSLVEGELERMDDALARSRRINIRAQRIEDLHTPNRLEASVAKAYGPPTSELVIRRCIELLGPQGSSTDLLLEKWYRDVKILDIFEGTGQIMRVLISRYLMGRQAAN